MRVTGRTVLYVVLGSGTAGLAAYLLSEGLKRREGATDQEEVTTTPVGVVHREVDEFTGTAPDPGGVAAVDSSAPADTPSAPRPALAYVAGNVATGFVPGVGLGGLIGDGLGALNDKIGRDGAAKVMTDAGMGAALQKYEGRQDNYSDANAKIDAAFDKLIPNNDGGHPVGNAIREGSVDALKAVVQAPVKAVAVLDTAFSALGAAIKKDADARKARIPPKPPPKPPAPKCRPVTTHRTAPFVRRGICPRGYVNHLFRECRQYYTRQECTPV